MHFDRNYIAVAILLALGVVLGVSGFLELLQQPPFSLSGATLWYEAVLNTFERGSQPFSNIPGGPENAANVPLQLRIARVLMPVALLYGVLVAIYQVFRHSLRRFAVRFWTNHVVVCSSGPLGVHIVRDLAGDKRRVVVVDMDPDNSDREPYHRLGVPVLLGGPQVLDATLQTAGVARASAIVALCESDLINVEVVLKAKNIVAAQRPEGLGPLRARAAVSDPDLRQACSLMLIDRAPGYEYGLIAMERNVVRRMLTQHPLDRDPAVITGARVHIVIVGFGGTGQALALEVARNAHFADQRPPVITVLDREATAALAAFLRQHPGGRQAADLRACDFDLREAVTGPLETAFELAPTRIVICGDGEAQNLAAAARLQRLALRMGMADLPMFVRLAHAPEIARAIAAAAGNALAGMEPFGEPETVCTAEIILDETLDRLARAAHQTYRDMLGPGALERPSNAPWERLAETYRDASRHTADHIGAKLRAVGRTPTSSGAGVRDFAFTPAEVELLARMEHVRWCAERYIAGWRYGATRDDDLMRHPSLALWEELSESERQKDRDMVLGIPRILASAGLAVGARAPA